MPKLPDALSPTLLPTRDRAILWGGLGAITVLAWVYFASMPSAAMGTVGKAVMGPAHTWSAADFWLTFVMWSVMMVAMMVPSASPMVTMYVRVARGRSLAPVLGGWLFATGYLVVWTVFSAGATVLQYALVRAAIMSTSLQLNPLLGGVILAAAGLYQFTPLKDACLSQCRSPLGFFLAEWREGPGGALRMGLKHGTFCVGCCWMLMAVLFVTGVMSLLWSAVIAAFVLLEKVFPKGRLIAHGAGVLLIASGVLVAVSG